MSITTLSLFERAGIDRQDARRHLAQGVEGADDGELYLEYAQSEALVFDNGRLKQATYNTDQGFGLRAVKDEAVGYAHSSELSDAALARAADAVRAVKGGYCGRYAEPPQRTNAQPIRGGKPAGGPELRDEIQLLATSTPMSGKDRRVRQVSISFGASWQAIEILRADGESFRDVRPLVRVNVSVVVGEGDRQESGSHGYGGREGFSSFLAGAQLAQGGGRRSATSPCQPRGCCCARRRDGRGAAPGWPGVMLHEAVGHGLEGDFNRKRHRHSPASWGSGWLRRA